jgi:hypothetical protein
MAEGNREDEDRDKREGEGEGGMTSGDPLWSSGAGSAFGGDRPSSAEAAFGGRGESGGWAPPSPAGGAESGGAESGSTPSGGAESGGTPSSRAEPGAPSGGAQPGVPAGWIPPAGSAGAGGSGGWQPPAGAQGSGGWQQPAAPPQGQWGQQPQPGGYVVPTSNGKATASLVCGIVGLVFCPIIFSIAALVLGYQARGEIDASQGRQHNRGSATAGIITGWIGIAFGILLLVLIAVGVIAGDESSGDGGDGFAEPAIALVANALAALPLL